MNDNAIFDLNSIRRFGVEIELNSLDLLSKPEDGKSPFGINYIANLVRKTLDENVLIHKWGNDHNNESWVLKPDSSCGLEVCTPVIKGWDGIRRFSKVVQEFSQDDRIKADERCSFHVHVEVNNLSSEQIASILTWWIKCEPVFMDSVPPKRKRSRYCQLIGLGDLEVQHFLAPETLIKKLGTYKYYSVNTLHLVNRKRNTIEFRIMDNEACLNPRSARNWTALILYFVERAISVGAPKSYVSGDPWSGYCWLDPRSVFEFLGFVGEVELSPRLQQIREWFLGRLYNWGRNSGLPGIMGDAARRIAAEEVVGIFLELGMEIRSTI
jgi:hypothetical protein